MQFLIAYYVLIISMSIIVLAEDVKDMIFNGLVVTFLADLDEYAWSALAAIFHMDEKYFEEFKFRLRNDPEVDDERNAARRSWKIWLYRGKGGKARILENWI